MMTSLFSGLIRSLKLTRLLSSFRLPISATILLLHACVLWVCYQFIPNRPAPCVSYSPFYQGSNPLDPKTVIPASQIEQDLRLLAKRFPFVRTYSVALGLDVVLSIVEKLGIKVYLGVWIGWLDKLNRQQIDTAVPL